MFIEVVTVQAQPKKVNKMLSLRNIVRKGVPKCQAILTNFAHPFWRHNFATAQPFSTFFFDKIKSLLKNDGLTLLHTIGTQEFVPHTDKWIDRYIFPNGSIPTAYETVVAIGDTLIIEDWHSFGQDYDKTIMAWSARFDEAWEGLSKRYDERFYRMWHYYLMSCAAYFRSRQGQLWQIVLSKRENPNVYRSFR